MLDIVNLENEPIYLGRKFSIRGREVEVVIIKSRFVPKQRPLLIVYVEASDGDMYRFVKWHDGRIYRVAKIISSV